MSVRVRLVQCRSALSPSRLPGLNWALNPYRGCEHACSYCYAQDVTRFEPGKPWGETVEVKVNIVELLRKELRRGLKGVCGIGTVTDPYQPLEKEYELTRRCLAELRRAGASVSVLTKSDLVLRDLDLLRDWPGAEVGVSVGCADGHIAGIIEPGAPAPEARFRTLSELSGNRVNCYLMAAPIVPGTCDSEQGLTELVRMALEAGVRRIMWDGFNPKPCAAARLRRSLDRLGPDAFARFANADRSRAQAVLSRECLRAGIELQSAF